VVQDFYATQDSTMQKIATEHLPVARHLSGSPAKLSFFTEAEIFQ
jgi:hypothetical protein